MFLHYFFFRAKNSVKHYPVRWDGREFQFGFGRFTSVDELREHFASRPVIGGESGTMHSNTNRVLCVYALYMCTCIYTHLVFYWWDNKQPVSSILQYSWLQATRAQWCTGLLCTYTHVQSTFTRFAKFVVFYDQVKGNPLPTYMYMYNIRHHYTYCRFCRLMNTYVHAFIILSGKAIGSHTHKYLDVAASDRDDLKLYKCCYCSSNSSNIIIIFGLSTELFSNSSFTIADSLYASPLTSSRFNTLPCLFSGVHLITRV